MNRYTLLGGGSMFIFVLVIGSSMYQPATSTTVPVEQPSVVSIGTTTIVVDVAATGAERTLGLSGRDSLAWDTGMLFIFPTEKEWGFWMKDMQFPIDIVWANEEGIINTVLSDVTPNTYPKVFRPLAPALYVLEVPAGYATAHGISVGQKIVVEYKERVE